VSASLQRSPVAPCRPVLPFPGPSRCGVCRAAGTLPACARARAVFRRLAFPRHFVRLGNAALRVIRRRIRSRRCTGPVGCSRDLGGSLRCTRRRSWGSPDPSQLFSWRRGRGRVSRVPGPTCRFARSVAASGFARGRATSRRARSGSGVRLLGVRPAAKPFPAVHRPRYSFCAEGRRDARAVAALGFESSLRVSESRAAGLRFRSLSAGACRRQRGRLCSDRGRRACRRARGRCAGPRA